MSRESKGKHIPPKNNNNESPEFFDESMICEEWVDVTDKYVLNNTSKSLPVTTETEIPPKSDTSFSELGLFDSPRNKKRKLKMPLSFDEIVAKLNYHKLYLKFKMLLEFLESGKSEMLFPSAKIRYQDLFKMIIQDINILKSRSLDVYHRDICNKIIEAASFKNSGYLLTYNFDYRAEIKNPVLVIKKVYTKSPFSLEGTSSSDSNQPSPLPEMEPNRAPKRFKNSISNGFKIHCLRTALAFVKNNVTENVEFPELTSEQAEFMQLLLESVITFADCENVTEVNELYRALWEAVKIHSTKYDFRINTVESCGDKKSLVFEKLPKQKRVESATFTKQRSINTSPPVVSTNPPTATENHSTEIKTVVFTNQTLMSVNKTTLRGIQPVVSTNQPVVSTNQPVVSTIQPVVSTNQPVGSAEPAINTTQPNVSTKQTEVKTNQPAVGGIQPVVGANQPEVKTNQPAVGGIQPVVGANQPEVKTNQPAVGGIQPVVGANQPEVKTNQPAVGGIQPVVGAKQPEVKANRPAVGGIQLVVGAKQPEVKANQPAVGGIQPVVGANQPEVKTKQPAVGGIQPVVSTNQPTGSANQPTLSGIQPETTKQPMASTNTTAALEIQPVVSTNQSTANPPILTSNQPIVSVNQPVFTPSQPVASGIQPVSAKQPVAGVKQPTVSGIQPKTSTNVQVSIKKQPAVGATQIMNPPLSGRKLAKLRNRQQFVYRLPRTFVYNAFKTVIDFLADEKRLTMVVIPCNQDELVFYRKCIEWTRKKGHAGIFDGEYKPFYDQIVEYLSYMKVQVPKPAKQKFHKGTGIREVTYVKKPKYHFNGVPLWNLPKPYNTTEFKIPNIYTSLRNKKKNKKLKNKNLVKVKTPKNKKSVDNRISIKSSDTSSVSSSSRGTSQERMVVQQTKAKNLTKRLPKEPEITPRGTNSKMRWRNDDARKEQLIEALSVPVQSDKAMKIMRGMGWSGGALGARGNGITEPIMPALDIPKGYGLGAYKIAPQPEIVPKKLATPKTVTTWTINTNNDTEQSENDIIVEKTKQLLLEKPSFDKVMKGVLNQPKTVSKIDSEIIDLDAEYPDDLYESTKIGENVPNNATVSTETPKSETKTAKNMKSKTTKSQVPTKTKYGALVAENPDANIEFVPRNFRREMLQTVLELLSTDLKSKTLTFDKPITKKNKQYMSNVLQNLKYSANVLVAWNEQSIADEIAERYKELPDVFVRGHVSDNRLEVKFEKLQISVEDRDINEIILDGDISDVTNYIRGTAFKCDTRKALDNLKFKVLILMKILEFVKSNNEEIEIVFNKVLPKKQKIYIDNVIESVNLRHKLGESPPEKKLSEEIKKNIKDAFLSHMFNHQYNAVTLSKHFRFKRLNRPDYVEKRKTLAAIDLDNYTSTSNPTDNPEITDKVHETADKEVTGNDNDVTDNDSLSDSNTEEDSNKIIGKVLPPRDETVNMYEYLYMYDTSTYSYKQNKDSDDKNTDFDRDIVIDNKNVEAQSKCMDVDEEEVEYLFCVENEEVDKEEIMLIDDFNSEEIKFSEKFFGNNSGVKTVNENCGEKTNNNIDEMIDEVLSNTETACDQKPEGNTKDENENISESQVTNNLDKTENQDEPMKEIDLNKKIEENRAKEELIEEIKDESSKGIGETSSKMDDEEIIKRIDDIIKTENETDCDISFDKDDLVLSEENCDNQSLEVSHSKTGQIENGVDVTDKKNTEINNVYIVNIEYPTVEITKERAKDIQGIISVHIMLSNELPLLKCHGVQNGALIYTCYNKSTFDFLENSIKNISDLKVLNTINVNKMSVKLFCLFDFDTVYLFNMIELYNKEVSTKQWVVETREFVDGYTILVIKMDKASIDFIHASDLALFAGVDKVEFSLIWE